MQTPYSGGQDRYKQGQRDDQFQNIGTVLRIRHIVIVMVKAEGGFGGFPFQGWINIAPIFRMTVLMFVQGPDIAVEVQPFFAMAMQLEDDMAVFLFVQKISQIGPVFTIPFGFIHMMKRRPMVLGLISGQPHASKSDQPGDLGQNNKHKDQHPVFGAPGSSREVGIMAERPLNQLADGYGLAPGSQGCAILRSI